VADKNPGAGFPLAVGPFSVTLSPVVAGLIPQFPVTFSAETFLNPPDNYRSIKTSISIHQDGQIVAQTVTHNGIELTGYKRCVFLALYDQNASSNCDYFYATAPTAFRSTRPYGDRRIAYAAPKRTRTSPPRLRSPSR